MSFLWPYLRVSLASIGNIWLVLDNAWMSCALEQPEVLRSRVNSLSLLCKVLVATTVFQHSLRVVTKQSKTIWYVTKMHETFFCPGWKLPVHVMLKLFFSLFGMGRYYIYPSTFLYFYLYFPTVTRIWTWLLAIHHHCPTCTS